MCNNLSPFNSVNNVLMLFTRIGGNKVGHAIYDFVDKLLKKKLVNMHWFSSEAKMIEIHESVGLNIILSLKLCVYFMLLVKLYCRNKFLWVYYVIKPIWPDDDGWKSLTRPFMLLLMKIAQQRVSLSRVVIKSVHLFDIHVYEVKNDIHQYWGISRLGAN